MREIERLRIERALIEFEKESEFDPDNAYDIEREREWNLL